MYNINSFNPIFSIDENWNLQLSHGSIANYVVQGKAIEILVDHIKYLENIYINTSSELIDWVKNCPECAAAKIEILQIDVEEWKAILKEKEAEISRLESELARK